MARSSCAELLRYFNKDLNKDALEELTAACAENGLEKGEDFRLAFGGFETEALELEVTTFLNDLRLQARSNIVLLVAVAKHSRTFQYSRDSRKGPSPK